MLSGVGGKQYAAQSKGYLNRIKQEDIDKRGNIASSNESWPELHQIVFGHGRMVPIAADILADKFYAIRTEEALLE